MSEPALKEETIKAVAKRKTADVPAPVAQSEEHALVSMIERLARDPTTNVETVGRFLEMRDKMRAQEAERAFNDAMAKAQSEMRPIAADADNKQTKSKYASYAALDRVLRPIYTKLGFALSFNTLPDGPPEHVRVVCDVTNCGHTRRYQIDMPSDGKGAKGGDVMTKTHATGSAVQYGMRYLLKMIWNVAVGEADDDGNKAGLSEFITPGQASKIKSLIVEVGADIQRFLVMGDVERVEDIPANQYDKVIALLEIKRGRAKK